MDVREGVTTRIIPSSSSGPGYETREPLFRSRRNDLVDDSESALEIVERTRSDDCAAYPQHLVVVVMRFDGPTICDAGFGHTGVADAPRAVASLFEFQMVIPSIDTGYKE